MIRWLVLLCASTALADTAIQAPRSPGQVRRASVHDAARLLSDAYHVNVLVAGPPTEVSVELSADPRASLGALAKAAGLSHRRWGTLNLLVPDERVHDILPPPTPSGADKRVDLDFAYVGLDKVIALCGDILKKKVTGAPDGDLSIRARGLSTRALVAYLQVLAKSRPGRATFDERATFPSSGFVHEPECVQEQPHLSPWRQPTKLFCTPLDSLRLLGTAREIALIAGPKGYAQLIRKGDLVSDKSARVVEISDGTVRLDNDTILKLP